MSKIALWTWAFERATTKNPMLRARAAHTKPWVHPAESVRTTRSRATSDRVVTGVVSRRDLRGQLGHGGVEDAHVVGHRVGAGVARTQQSRERLAGGIGEAEHRVEAPAALVVRARALLGLGVDLDERRVDVEDHRRRARGGGRTSPHLGAHVGERLGQRVPTSG